MAQECFAGGGAWKEGGAPMMSANRCQASSFGANTPYDDAGFGSNPFCWNTRRNCVKVERVGTVAVYSTSDCTHSAVYKGSRHVTVETDRLLNSDKHVPI